MLVLLYIQVVQTNNNESNSKSKETRKKFIAEKPKIMRACQESKKS